MEECREVASLCNCESFIFFLKHKVYTRNAKYKTEAAENREPRGGTMNQKKYAVRGGCGWVWVWQSLKAERKRGSPALALAPY